MNIIMSDKKNFYISSLFNEMPEYFTMCYKMTEDTKIVCSMPLDDSDEWTKIDNKTLMVI